MFTGASFQPHENESGVRFLSRVTLASPPPFVLAATFVALSIAISVAQQPASGPSKAQPSARSASAKSSSPFLEAETLLQQGSVEEAKKKIQEQLAIKPSVEGYNLLEIAYTNEKDFNHAVDAFNHALKLAPDATKIRNNLGNLYFAQEKFDLAEKEFTTVLRGAPTNQRCELQHGSRPDGERFAGRCHSTAFSAYVP